MTSLPPPPNAPLLKSPTASMSRPQFNFAAPQLSQQQIEERLNKTREVLARIGQIKALSPQLTQSSYVFISTNSNLLNETLAILPRIENDGKFELPPIPSISEIRSSLLPPSKSI